MSNKEIVSCIAAVVIVAMTLLTVWFIVDNIMFTSNTSGNPVGFSWQPTPRFTLEDSETRADTPLLGSSTAYYDVYVKNVGDGGGYVTIHARMTQKGTAVDREQTKWINAGERSCITFSFSEYSRWNGDATFRAWI